MLVDREICSSMYQPEAMSKENNSVFRNEHGGDGESENPDVEMFLFTSESVGEGHPGMQNF